MNKLTKAQPVYYSGSLSAQDGKFTVNFTGLSAGKKLAAQVKAPSILTAINLPLS